MFTASKDYTNEFLIKGKLVGQWPLDTTKNVIFDHQVFIRIKEKMRFEINIVGSATQITQSINGEGTIIKMLHGKIELKNENMLFKVTKACENKDKCSSHYPEIEAGRPLIFTLKLTTNLENEGSDNYLYDYQGKTSEHGTSVACPNGKAYYVQSVPDNPNQPLCDDCSMLISRSQGYFEKAQISYSSTTFTMNKTDLM